MLRGMKIDGILARNVDFVKFEDVSHEMLVLICFDAPTCLVSSRWLSSAVAVSIGEAAKPLLVEGFKTGCNVVLPGRRGAS